LPKQTFTNLDHEKQERVIRSAIAEFQENGFANAKVGNIAKKAEIAKGSIYQYFEDKEALFIDTVSWTVDYLQQYREQQTLLNHLDVFEYLLSSGRQRIEIIRREPGLSKFLQDVYAGKYIAVMKNEIQELWWISDASIRQMIEFGKNRGSIRQDIEDDVLVTFFKATLKTIDQMIIGTMDENTDIDLQMLDMKIRGFMKLIRTGMGS
jgi:AcrR family transcriptional regulator